MRKGKRLNEIAYTIIKTKVVHCELKPGRYIDEPSLVSELGISRTPAREAMLRLASEGILEAHPGKGFFVPYLSVNDMRELYDVRILLEVPALEALIQKMSPEIENRLLVYREYFDSFVYSLDKIEDWTKMDNELHMIMIDAYGNSQFKKLYEVIELRSQRIRYLIGITSQKQNSTGSREHVQLIDFILAGNKDSAVEVLKQHIGWNNVVEDVLRISII